MEEEKKDEGIFTKQKINFHPKSEITNLLACNNLLVLALKNGVVMRIPLQQPDKQTEIDVPHSSGDRIAHLHLDPTGKHLLISMAEGDVFYLHASMSKVKALPKLKGNVISAVGWNQQFGKDMDTGFIVVGTSKGLLFETELVQAGQVQYWKQLYSVSDDPSQPQPIVGLELHRCSTPPNRWCLFVATPGTLYPFAGTVSLQSTSTWTTTEHSGHLLPLFLADARIHTLDPVPPTNGPTGLKVYPMFGDDPPTRFAWVTAVGVKYGRMDTSAADAFRMTVDDELLTHPEMNGRPDFPLGIALTEFHLLLVYHDRLVAVSTMNEQVMYEDYLGQKFGKIGGVTRDPASGMIWVFTDKSVLRYRPVDEARYVWKIYLDRGEYLLARQHASGNQSAFDLVLRKQGEKLINEKKFVAAAEVLSMTNAPFEETALKFVTAEDRNGLKTFLEKKLDQLEPMDKTRRDMLVLWLLEVHLTELGEVKSGVVPADQGPTKTEFDQARYKALREQFRFFLGRTAVVETIKGNSESVYQMMNTHGDTDSLLFFAHMLRDYDTVVNLHIQQEMHQDALKVLVSQSDSTLFYKFSPALIDAIPDKLVDAWIAQGPKLQPKRLLPALFRCVKEQVKVDAAIRFLEHCLVKHEKDQAIHNFLISLYARHRPEKLLDYLLIQGSDRNTICYDVKFALRVCSEKGLDRACVHLYSVSELHEEAITLALKLNVNLAKQYAKLLMQNNFDDRGSSIITDPHELRKKIWLKIARHVVEKEQDIAACMELMTESNGILKIQDLLPFFPEFATIEHFKESLCACLKEHSGKIQELQKEMKEATDVATDIRTDMAKLKNKYTIVRVQDKCGLCADAVMARPFYAFPCRHFFHTDCLEKEIGAFLPNESIEKLASLKRQLLTVQTTAGGAQPNTIGVGSNGDSRTNEQERQIRVKIDDILATECPWCGQLMINSVNKPFYTLAQYGSELKTWDVR